MFKPLRQISITKVFHMLLHWYKFLNPACVLFTIPPLYITMYGDNYVEFSRNEGTKHAKAAC